MQNNIREGLSSEKRVQDVIHTIDPGFVNMRRIQTILGKEGIELINIQIANLPPMEDWQKTTQINHIYSMVMLEFCRINVVKSLEELVATRKGQIFCSTEVLGPCPDIYNLKRAVSEWIPRGETNLKIEFHYSTRHITSDTLWGELDQGDTLSIIAELKSFSENIAIFHPLIIGSPWIEAVDPKWKDVSMFWGYDFFENRIEDFDEFSEVKNHTKPKDVQPMKNVSEIAFKTCLAEIIGGEVPKDWGGETSDFFTSHINMGGKRVSGAFLLKGPARFIPMTLDQLGKRNDQIVRLAQEPADVLFVQHSHEITSAVRSTLRAFSVQPSRPRHFCLIDGRDSLWLLQSYGLYEKAVALSKK
jgi:hypothetical protein